jgi:hypothetical protein
LPSTACSGPRLRAQAAWLAIVRHVENIERRNRYFRIHDILRRLLGVRSYTPPGIN